MSRNSYCEPCGECSWCHGNWKAKREVKALRAALRKALRQIDRLAGDLEEEVNAAGLEGGEQQHPTIGCHRRDAGSARRVAARLQPLTKARR